MKYLTIIISLLVFALASLHSIAQQSDSGKYVYVDSSEIPKDTSVEKLIHVDTVTDAATDEDEPLVAIRDTVLRLNNLTISGDSIMLLRNSKPFAYSKNLDSLLQAWQKEHQVKLDTNESPNWMDIFFSSIVTKVILCVLAGSFVLFILYKLFFVQGFFQKKAAQSNVNEIQDADTVSGQQDYNFLITQAINSRNYRLAVRYMYLQTLQKLAEKNLVQLAADKTNYQYITELNNTAYKDDFLWLTMNYEYVWYGEFALDEAAIEKIQHNFKQFNNRLA